MSSLHAIFLLDKMRRSNRLAKKVPQVYDDEYVHQESFTPPTEDEPAFESVTPHVIQRRRITCSPRVVVLIATFVIVAMILFFPLNVEAVSQPSRYPNFRRTMPIEPWLPSKKRLV